ncbi:MAG: tetratricopeptide repeat protein [Deltaproteobacteria bacterium]|nr:tetratricopeptide repeat protein [Deltaproteobacteria bacterium]MBW2120256.1 tetratricopeptide repeat protein [Deltaproteobacteria bacterium]
MRILAFVRRIRLYALIAGSLCLCYGIYEKYWYADLIAQAVRTVERNQFDTQYLEEAGKNLFASEDILSYNMGVRAYRARNLKKASEHFFEVIRNSGDPRWKERAYYNLGNIMAQLELPTKAAEMYREAIRLDPTDWESKYNLERLYVFYPRAFPKETEQASLDKEPGEEEPNKSQMGKHGVEEPDI